MRFSRLAVLATPLLTVSVAAQIPQIGPAVTKWSSTTTGSTTEFTAQRFPALGSAAIVGSGTSTSALSQIELRTIPGTQTFRGAATVTGYTGPASGGGQDVGLKTYVSQRVPTATKLRDIQQSYA